MSGEWHRRCARCGSPADWHECRACDGGYILEDWGDDVVSEWHEVPCPRCRGHRGYYICIAAQKTCEDFPLKGREAIQRGQLEVIRKAWS